MSMSLTDDEYLNPLDLDYIQENTNLSLQRILDFYRTFLSKYNNGYVNRQQFIDIIKKLFIDNNNNTNTPDVSKPQDDPNGDEKIAMCERLFDVCDHDDDGNIDFKEYLVLFWSKVNGKICSFCFIFLILIVFI